MDDKAARVSSMFTAIAGRYDLLNRVLSLGMDMAWRRFAVSMCTNDNSSLVLDVATGTGDMALLLAERNCTVVGLDFCPDMLDKARIKAARAEHGERIRLVKGDALRLPFPDSAFDCAAIGFALRNVTDISGVFREIARVLRPGGSVVSLELTRPRPPVLKVLHGIYMWHLLRYIGGLISGNRSAYSYLPESIVEHITPEEVRKIMQDVGFRDVEFHRLSLGTATVHAGEKI